MRKADRGPAAQPGRGPSRTWAQSDGARTGGSDEDSDGWGGSVGWGAGEVGAGEGAAAFGGPQLPLAADLPDHQRDDGQAEPGAGQAPCRRRTPEPLEDVRKFVRRDARALVSYGQLAVPFVRVQPYVDGAARRAELHRVVEEVHHGPFQRPGVALHAPRLAH